ncbi:MAG: hypothetical protein MR842_06805, partial [Clostridiales bacterium]|nr:hypothetical protein [Clostridiales bacterium]
RCIIGTLWRSDSSPCEPSQGLFLSSQLKTNGFFDNVRVRIWIGLAHQRKPLKTNGFLFSTFRDLNPMNQACIQMNAVFSGLEPSIPTARVRFGMANAKSIAPAGTA